MLVMSELKSDAAMWICKGFAIFPHKPYGGVFFFNCAVMTFNMITEADELLHKTFSLFVCRWRVAIAQLDKALYELTGTSVKTDKRLEGTAYFHIY